MSAAPLPWLAEPLAEALRSMQGHALLVHGPSGVGQFELAQSLAAAWLCEEPTPAGACGHCVSCRLIAARTHPDLRVLVPEALRVTLGWDDDAEAARDGEGKKAKPSRELKVEAVRELIVWAHSTSSRGRGKVAVLYPAHAMNAVAANALLKTLEEPPAGMRLVLATFDPELLLPTLRSRCQRWALQAPLREEALRWLAAQGIDPPEVLLDAAGGRPLDAQAMAQDGLSAAGWLALPAAVAKGDARPLSGWGVPRVVDALQKLCHDAMSLASGGAARFFPRAPFPPALDFAALAAWSKSLNRVARHDEHPWNAGLLIESLVLEGSRAWVPTASPSAAGRFATLPVR
jgi:DNA polymerase-3 subunit delta'